MRNDTRSSAAQSYLFSSPSIASVKPNLHIHVEHRTTRIIWNTTSGQLPRLQGVAIQSQDSLSPAREMIGNVEKEVIISAGALAERNFAFL